MNGRLARCTDTLPLTATAGVLLKKKNAFCLSSIHRQRQPGWCTRTPLAHCSSRRSPAGKAQRVTPRASRASPSEVARPFQSPSAQRTAARDRDLPLPLARGSVLPSVQARLAEPAVRRLLQFSSLSTTWQSG